MSHRPGDYRVICDTSGFKCWASETVLQWNNLRVLKRFADIRNPQDFPRIVREMISVPDARPEPDDNYPARITPADL